MQFLDGILTDGLGGCGTGDFRASSAQPRPLHMAMAQHRSVFAHERRIALRTPGIESENSPLKVCRHGWATNASPRAWRTSAWKAMAPRQLRRFNFTEFSFISGFTARTDSRLDECGTRCKSSMTWGWINCGRESIRRTRHLDAAVGMDEAHRLGMGRGLKQHGYQRDCAPAMLVIVSATPARHFSGGGHTPVPPAVSGQISHQRTGLGIHRILRGDLAVRHRFPVGALNRLRHGPHAVPRAICGRSPASELLGAGGPPRV